MGVVIGRMVGFGGDGVGEMGNPLKKVNFCVFFSGWLLIEMGRVPEMED